MENLKERSNIIIVGSGISGIVCASLLDSYHQVTLIEANDRLGGHTHTINVSDNDIGNCSIDTGFIVFNEMNYPNFVSFLKRFNVEHQPSDMSFGIMILLISIGIRAIFQMEYLPKSVICFQLHIGNYYVVFLFLIKQYWQICKQMQWMGLSLMDYLNIKQFFKSCDSSLYFTDGRCNLVVSNSRYYEVSGSIIFFILEKSRAIANKRTASVAND